MKVVVTGATGFVGRHLVSQLVARGHHVTVLVRDEVRARQFSWAPDVRLAGFTLDDPEAVSPATLEDQDAVVHLAWPGLPNYGAPFHYEDNLPAAYRFLKQCIAANISQVLVTGTCFEYGLREGKLIESMYPNPANAYSLAKDTLRKFLECWREEHPFTLQWARLFYMFGEGQNPKSLLAQLDQAIDGADSGFNMSAGEQLRDYLSISEVARRLTLLIEHPEVEGVTNICSGQPVSVRSLVEKHIADRGATIKLNLGYYPYSKFEPLAFWGDASRIESIDGRP
jgi:nucleoside-diphosphate-sugar epimerase